MLKRLFVVRLTLCAVFSNLSSIFVTYTFCCSPSCPCGVDFGEFLLERISQPLNMPHSSSGTRTGHSADNRLAATQVDKATASAKIVLQVTRQQ